MCKDTLIFEVYLSLLLLKFYFNDAGELYLVLTNFLAFY